MRLVVSLAGALLIAMGALLGRWFRRDALNDLMQLVGGVLF